MKTIFAFAFAVALASTGTTFAGDCGGGCDKKDGDKKDTVTLACGEKKDGDKKDTLACSGEKKDSEKKDTLC